MRPDYHRAFACAEPCSAITAELGTVRILCRTLAANFHLSVLSHILQILPDAIMYPCSILIHVTAEPHYPVRVFPDPQPLVVKHADTRMKNVENRHNGFYICVFYHQGPLSLPDISNFRKALFPDHTIKYGCGYAMKRTHTRSVFIPMKAGLM